MLCLLYVLEVSRLTTKIKQDVLSHQEYYMCICIYIYIYIYIYTHTHTQDSGEKTQGKYCVQNKKDRNLKESIISMSIKGVNVSEKSKLSNGIFF